MANDVVLIEFKAKTDKFTAESKAVTDSINKSDQAVKKFEKDATQAYSKAGSSANKATSSFKQTGQSFNQLGAGITQVAGAMGVALSAQAVINFGKESVKAFLEAEQNAQLLLFALKGNEQAQERLLNQASRLQQTTIYDDDSIQQAQTFLANQGRTEKQIMKVIDAAVELSSVTGVDLQTAVMQLDATFEGNIGKMGKLDSAFKDLTKEELANGAAADLLIEKYGGTAKAIGDTTAGQVEKLKNQFGELQETVGGEIVQFIMPVVEGLNALFKGDFSNSKIFDAFDNLTGILQVMPGPLAAIIRGFKEFRQVFFDIQDGNYVDALGDGLEGVANIISMGLYGTIKDAVSGTKEYVDTLTDQEKAQLDIIRATDKELEEKRQLIIAQNGNTDAFDKYVASVRQSEIDKIFGELNRTLGITETQYKQLTDISDLYNRSASISATLIQDIATASDKDLDAAFKKYNTTLGVTREHFDDYIGKVKKIIKENENLGDGIPKVVSPWDQLNKVLGELNKKMLDYLTLGKDATHLDRERFELQNKINKIQAEYNALINSHNPIAKDNSEINKVAAESLTLLGTAALGTLEPTKQLPFNMKAITEASKEQAPTIEDLIDKWQEAANIAGALADLGNALNNALTQIFGEAAEKNAVFAAFQKAITIATITFKSIEAVANGVAAFSAGVTSGDPTKIIGGIASIVSGVGNLIGGLIQQVNAVQTPNAPTFYEGTHDTGTGGNVDSKGGFWSILHPHEGVLNRDANSVFSPFVKAANAGEGMSYIKDNWIAPALKAHEEQMKNDFASNIATSLMFNGFDDYRLARLATEGNGLLKENNTLLAKSLRMKNPWSV